MNASATPCKQGPPQAGKAKAKAGAQAATLRLKRRPGAPCEALLFLAGQAIRCAIGRSGIHAPKREGDGATPIGRLRLLEVLYRADRGLRPRTRLPVRPIRSDDGWCDAAFDANYNKPVRLPFRPSHETMSRADGLYDIVVVLDWNITRRLQGRGSAIFLHIARPGYRPTEGCIAVTPAAMRRLLARLAPGASIRIDGR